ncbi:hypothetical protein BOX15_Mlig005371g2 [Macrostomum lignano]|uniref:Uncharacterized protein n=2 Tax=Macrostomum lignano TaxID=282301 RepID=A0A267GHP6_9PLAT|nr:hypothetical protein BOX15_Mlig005371g2 [Macrostomum lignano]
MRFPLCLFNFVIAHILFSVFCPSTAENKFVTEVNPSCQSLCNNGTLLVYSRLQRSADSLHVFVTVGEGLGDVAISYAQFDDPKQVASVSWPDIFSANSTDKASALSFSNPKAKLMSKFTFAFTNLIEYSDKNDKVEIPTNPVNTTHVYPFSSFLWRLEQAPEILSNGLTQFVLSAYSMMETMAPEVDPATYSVDNAGDEQLAEIFKKNGSSLKLKVQLSPTVGRADDLPQLQFTSNNTQVEFQLKDLFSSVPDARFGVETVLLDGTPDADGMQREQKIEYVLNIDDEFTPGVFRMSNWLSPDSCYAQWKPVCYKAEKRTISNSTVVKHTDLVQLSVGLTEALNNSFAYPLYGGDLLQLTGARAINVTFGIPKDKFYAATNYTVWTVSVGLGQPPADAVSTLVIIVILCGLGLPFLLMSAAVIYLCVRRCRQPAPDGAVSAYQPINA